MSQHGRDIQAAIGHEVEVVGDGVLALAAEVLDAECIRTGDGDLLE